MGNSDWWNSGFTDDYKQLGKLIGSGNLRVPIGVELSLNKEEIQYLRERRTERFVVPDPTLLNEFIGLWAMTPAAILRFAKRWGVLFLDSFGRPCQPRKSVGTESLEIWRYFSKRATAVLNIAAALKKNKIGALEDWNALRDTSTKCGSLMIEMSQFAPTDHFLLSLERNYPFGDIKTGPPDFTRDVEIERGCLMVEMYAWLKLGRVGFVVLPTERGWTMEVDFGGCFLSAVAIQLAQTLANVDALYTCSECGRPYPRNQKRPKSGESNFCPDCGRSAALRQADQRRRARVVEAKKLDKEGLTVTGIAKQLDADPGSVRRWLKKGKTNAKTTRTK